MKVLLGTILAACSMTAQADECPVKLPYGNPVGLKSNTLTSCKSEYTIKFNPDCKIPYFVIENLQRSEFELGRERATNFIQDSNIPLEYQSSGSDYYKSGYDRGHMAASRNYTLTSELMKETYIYTNVVPQIPSNNRGIWKRLENYVRLKADSTEILYVISGSIETDYKIGSGVCVPDKLYKVLIDPTIPEIEYYLIPNSAESNKLSIEDFKVSREYLESITGIKFTPNKTK